jgi:hypothetical protein
MAPSKAAHPEDHEHSQAGSEPLQSPPTAPSISRQPLLTRLAQMRNNAPASYSQLGAGQLGAVSYCTHRPSRLTLNPIEKAFSEIRVSSARHKLGAARLHRGDGHGARCSISFRDARGFFEHTCHWVNGKPKPRYKEVAE